MRPALIALAALVASLTLLAAGCGEDDGASEGAGTEEWAQGFCSAVSAWTDELERVGDEVSDLSSLTADKIREAGDDLDVATEQFVEEVRALGRPETTSGQQVEESIDQLAETVETERDDIREAVENVSELTEIAAAVSAVGASLTAMGDAFGDTLQALEDADVDGELERALENEPECDALTN
jgi:methyl-accepting chemotaxis protein